VLGVPFLLATGIQGKAAQPPIIVKMLDMPPSFQPQSVTIKVGDTVEWQNVGNAVHHATDDHEMAIAGSDVASPKGASIFDSGFMRPGESFTHTFTQPGIYKYVCVAHEASGMTGEIIVHQ
jgi:plastocyanin